MSDNIKDMTAYQLAGMAECGAPDKLDSAGATFLISVHDMFVEAVTEGRLIRGQDDDTDVIHDIAHNAIPVYTHEKWLTFVDLAAFNEDPSDYVDGGKIEDMDSGASTCLFIIAERLCWALLTELDNNDDDAS